MFDSYQMPLVSLFIGDGVEFQRVIDMPEGMDLFRSACKCGTLTLVPGPEERVSKLICPRCKSKRRPIERLYLERVFPEYLEVDGAYLLIEHHALINL